MTESEVTTDAIIDYLANRPKYEAVFKVNKGLEYIAEASRSAKPNTFNYYYGRMKKFTLLRMYDNYGIDVSWLYDPRNVIDTKKRQEQEDWLDATSLVDIANKVDRKIEEIKSKYVDDELDEGMQAGDGIDELLDDLQKHPEVGIPLYGPLINTVTRGARLRKFYLRSAATGIGKAIPNNTILHTPMGDREAGSIRIGDYLFDRLGQPTKVIGVYPQGKKQVWEITFSDGRKAQCCEDHLWTYRYETHRGYAYRTESLKEIVARAKTLKNGLKDSCNKGFRFHIPLNRAVEYEERNYYLHPYAMGALLGDGSFRFNSSNRALSFSSSSDELPNLVALYLPVKAIAHKSGALNYSYTFKPVDNIKHNLWVEELLKDYPDLWQARSEDKYIPIEYLHGSIVQRYYLLEGLLDTDGSIDEKGRVSFFTVSPRLRDNVIELCRSLGMIATYLTDEREGKYTTGEGYRIQIQCKKDYKPLLFRLSYKADRARWYAASNLRNESKDHLAIVSIEPTETEAEMTCFTVDNSEHLFLMNDFIVTHNTRTMIADAWNFAASEIWSEQFGMWVKNGPSNPTLFIVTEQDMGEFQTMSLAFLADVDEEHILNNMYEEGEWERILKAKEIIKRSCLWVEHLPDFSIQDVENKIKKHIREHNVKYIMFDYLHTSMKILEEVSRRSGGVRLREDNVLFMLSTHLKDIANQYGVFIMSATQLNADYQDSETPDQNLLRGAKSIADRIDLGAILLSVTDDDLKKIEPIMQLHPEFPSPTIKLSIYKNRRGRYRGVYLWCKANLGTCRVEPMFMTDWRCQLVSIEDIKILVEDDPAPWEEGE